MFAHNLQAFHFDRLGEFCAPAGSCLLLLMLWACYSECRTNLLCVLLFLCLFSPNYCQCQIVDSVFTHNLQVFNFDRLDEFCAPAGSCLLLFMLCRYLRLLHALWLYKNHPF